nr:acyl carrier protein [uncultured Ruegeria sp.]
MHPEEQLQSLRDYVRVTLLGGLNVTDDEELLLSGKIDSLGVMSLVAFVEQTYSIEIPLEDVTLENLSCITAISVYAENRRIAVS